MTKHELGKDIADRNLNEPSAPQTTRYAPNSFESQQQARAQAVLESRAANEEIVKARLQAWNEANNPAPAPKPAQPHDMVWAEQRIDKLQKQIVDLEAKITTQSGETPSEVGALLQQTRHVDGMLTNMRGTKNIRPRRYGPYDLLIEDISRPHFEVEYLTSTSVRVHGGRWLRWSVVFNSGTFTVTARTPLFQIDSGTDVLYSGIKDIALPPSSSGYVYLQLDSATAPSTITATYDPLFSVAFDNRGTKIPIAYITLSSNVITNIEQLRSGDICDTWVTS